MMKRKIGKLTAALLCLALALSLLAGLLPGSLTAAKADGATTFTIQRIGNAFTVTRSGDLSKAQTVKYRTVSLTAMDGKNFEGASGELSFAAGSADANTTVPVPETAAADVSSPFAYQAEVSGQNGTTRSYRFEVLDQGGFVLASKPREISYGSSHKIDTSKAYAEKDVTFSGTVTVTDDGYAQGYRALPIANYFSATAPQDYLVSAGAKLYMTVDFQAYEKDDGYQYIQILADETSNCDQGAGDGDPGTVSYSHYMAGFGHDPGKKNTTSYKYSFPYLAAGGNCNAVDKAWNGLNNTVGKLYKQKYKAGTCASDGRLTIPTDLKTLGIRLNASGTSSDTWYASSITAHIQAEDTTAPKLAGDPIISAGPYCRGNKVYISIPFSEIVTVDDNKPILNTTWGNGTYYTGSGTNVLTYYLTITKSNNMALSTSGFAQGSIKDLSGKSFNNTSLSYTFPGVKVQASYNYPITYELNGGTLPEGYPKKYTYDSAVTLSNPTRTGYTFDGWTGSNGATPQTSVSIAIKSHEPKSYTANWSLNNYTLTYNTDGGAWPEGSSNPTNYTVESNDITLTNPTRTGYDFAGWTGTDLDAPTQNVTIQSGSTGNRSYKANWTLKTQTITWKMDDGTLIDTTEADYFTTPVHVEPVKQPTAEFNYTFTGWSDGETVYGTNELPAVNGDATYTAVFRSELNLYEIVWKNWDGTALATSRVPYGHTPAYSNTTAYSEAEPTPSRTADAEFTYTFSGWTPTIIPVDGNANYTATYSETRNEYTVTFLNDDGTELQSGDVPYGQTPVYQGETPQRDSDEDYHYSFWGWSDEDNVTRIGNLPSVSGAATYTAVYFPSFRTYQITKQQGENQSYTINAGGSAEDARRGIELELSASVRQTGLGISSWHVTAANNQDIEVGFDEDTGYPIFTMPASDVTVSATTAAAQTITAAENDQVNGFYLIANGVHQWENFAGVPGTLVYLWIQPVTGADVQSVTVTSGGTDQDYPAVPHDGYRTVVFPMPDGPATITFHTVTATWGDNLSWYIANHTLTLSGTGAMNEAADNLYPWTFYLSQINNLIVGSGVTSIAAEAFPSVRFSNVTIPSSLTDISENAFVNAQVITVLFDGTAAEWQALSSQCGTDSGNTGLLQATVYTRHTVTFRNADETELQSIRVYDGDRPVFTGDTPTQAADTQYTYTFSGWTNGTDSYGTNAELPVLTQEDGNPVYTAVYTPEPRPYTVTFLDEDGTELVSSPFGYGEEPYFTGDWPVKADDAEHSYDFYGWKNGTTTYADSESLPAVNGDTAYTAVFAPVARRYNIQVPPTEHCGIGFNSENEHEICKATAGTKIRMEISTEAGWGIASLSVIDGTSTSIPVRMDAETGYAAAFTMPASDVTVSATAGQTKTIIVSDNAQIENCRIATNGVFQDQDSAQSFTGRIDSNSVQGRLFNAVPGTNVTIMLTPENGYAAGGISVQRLDEEDPSRTSGDARCYATAASTIDGTAYRTATFQMPENDVLLNINEYATYTIRFVDWDGSLLQTSNENYGDTPSYGGSTPVQEDTDEAYFAFSGWTDGNNSYGADDPLPAVTGEATYTATYTAYPANLSPGDNPVLLSSSFDIIYRFTPAESGWYRFQSAGSNSSLLMYLYDDKIRVASSIITEDGLNFSSAARLEQGETYTVYIGSYDSYYCMLTTTIRIEKTTAWGITVDPQTAHGSVSTNSSTNDAPAGKLISLSAEPEAGYGLGAWHVTDADGQEVPVIRDEKSWRFQMPASAVTVSATFGKLYTVTLTPNADYSFLYTEINGIEEYELMGNSFSAPAGSQVTIHYLVPILTGMDAEITAADGAPVSSTVKRNPLLEAAFTMPEAPVTVTLRKTGQTVSYTAVGTGENSVSSGAVYAFTPDTAGKYSFRVSGGEDECYLYRMSAECALMNLSKTGDTYEAMLPAGVPCYLCPNVSSWQEGVPMTLTITRTEESAVYTITTDSQTAHGTVTAGATAAPAGAEILLTVHPEEGYILDILSVTCGSQYVVYYQACCGEFRNSLVKNCYGFEMPDGDVSVTATFRRAWPVTVNADWTQVSGVIRISSNANYFNPSNGPILVGTGDQVQLGLSGYTPTNGYGTVGPVTVSGTEDATQEGDGIITFISFTMPDQAVTITRTPADATVDLTTQPCADPKVMDCVISQCQFMQINANGGAYGNGATLTETSSNSWDLAFDEDATQTGPAPWLSISRETNAETGKPEYVFSVHSLDEHGEDTYATTWVRKTLSFPGMGYPNVTFIFNRPAVITWKDDEGNVIDTTEAEYGQTPTHADPVKAADSLYTYTFTGWEPAIIPATEDATYTAQFAAERIFRTGDNAVTVPGHGSATGFFIPEADRYYRIRLLKDGALLKSFNGDVKIKQGNNIQLNHNSNGEAVFDELRLFTGGERYSLILYSWDDDTADLTIRISEATVYQVNISTAVRHGEVFPYYISEAEAGDRIPLFGYATDEGYTLTEWIVTGADGEQVAVQYENGNPYFIMPAQDVTVGARFTKATQYPITIRDGSGGRFESSISVNGVTNENRTAPAGAAVRMVYLLASEAMIRSVTVTGESGSFAAQAGIIRPDGDFPEWAISFTMPAEPVTVTVEAGPAEEPSGTLYTGTNTVTLDRVYDDQRYTCYSFTPETSGSYQVTVSGWDEDRSFHGKAEKYYGSGFNDYRNGDSIPMKAGERWLFAWYDDLSATELTVTIARTGDNPYSHTISAAPGITHGTIRFDSTEVEAGETVYLTMMPEPGYMLSGLTITAADGGTVGFNYTERNGFTFTMPNQNVTVSATFAEALPIAVTENRHIEMRDMAVYSENQETILAYYTSASQYQACPGSLAAMYFDPIQGYQFTGATVNAADGTPVDCMWEVGEGRLCVGFTMPGQPVTVTVGTATQATETLTTGVNANLPTGWYLFTPAESGEYTFAFEYDGERRIYLYDADGHFIESSSSTFSYTLAGGRTLLVQAYGEYYDMNSHIYTEYFDTDLTITRTGDSTDIFSVTVDPAITGGTVTTNFTQARANEWIALTVMPEKGYETESLTVTAGSRTLDTAEEDGLRYFHMPKENVTITAVFAKLPTPDFGTPTFTMPTALTKIEESAFEGNPLMTAADAGHCKSIGKWAFKDSGITKIRLPKNCNIDALAFEGCGTVYVFAPAGGITQAYCQQRTNPCIFVETN